MDFGSRRFKQGLWAGILLASGAVEPALGQDNTPRTTQAPIPNKDQDLQNFLFGSQAAPQMDMAMRKGESPADYGKRVTEYTQAMAANAQAGSTQTATKTPREILTHLGAPLPQGANAGLDTKLQLSYFKNGQGFNYEDAARSNGYAWRLATDANGARNVLQFAPLPGARPDGSMGQMLTTATTTIARAYSGQGDTGAAPQREQPVAPSQTRGGVPAGQNAGNLSPQDMQVQQFLDAHTTGTGYNKKTMVTPEQVLTYMHQGQLPNTQWGHDPRTMKTPMEVITTSDPRNIPENRPFNGEENAETGAVKLTIYQGDRPGDFANNVEQGIADEAQKLFRIHNPPRRGRLPGQNFVQGQGNPGPNQIERLP